ncbi:hypothetical protein [Paraburkholderia sp. RL17-373-BIF-A]|uniref:hypothetical protein n=1 Tax=Paraburkholderia sp. RL17-373-BIF-A TaxID=3031629 RepID=UPI0038B90D46
MASDERVTVISDDAGEFAKTVEGSQLARGRILDWFHIAMKFQAALRPVFGSKMIGSMDQEPVETEITHAKWLVWHGKGSKAVERIKALDSRLLAREGYEFKTLWWHLNTVSSYLRNNAPTLVNYSARHRKGLPISSSIAESAVNQVVSYRMARKRQMRWTGEGAHCMAQVRVAVLNGEFSSHRISGFKIAASRHGECTTVALPGRHRAPNRPCNPAISQCGQTKSTSPTFERSPVGRDLTRELLTERAPDARRRKINLMPTGPKFRSVKHFLQTTFAARFTCTHEPHKIEPNQRRQPDPARCAARLESHQPPATLCGTPGRRRRDCQCSRLQKRSFKLAQYGLFGPRNPAPNAEKPSCRFRDSPSTTQKGRLERLSGFLVQCGRKRLNVRFPFNQHFGRWWLCEPLLERLIVHLMFAEARRLSATSLSSRPSSVMPEAAESACFFILVSSDSLRRWRSASFCLAKKDSSIAFARSPRCSLLMVSSAGKI